MTTERLPRLTHGRHCRCTPCARQDWSDPSLAHCGMHGLSCPAVYDPYDRKEYEARAEGQRVVVHVPGEPHRYRITCEICGETGTIRLSVDPQNAATAPEPEAVVS